MKMPQQALTAWLEGLKPKLYIALKRTAEAVLFYDSASNLWYKSIMRQLPTTRDSKEKAGIVLPRDVCRLLCSPLRRRTLAAHLFPGLGRAKINLRIASGT